MVESILDDLDVIYGEGLSSNVFLIQGKEGTLAIDSGASKVIGKEPEMLVLTHAHYDHTGGVNGNWKNVYLHENDFSGGPYFNVPENAKPIDFKEIKWGEYLLEILHTPGHTMGSICLYDRKRRILFSGDTLFAEGTGRTDLGGDYKLMEKSLKSIAGLGWETLCPGHGEIARR